MLRDSRGAIVFIDWRHYLIHAGRAFSARERTTTGSILEYLIETGALELHITPTVKASLACPIDYLANVTVSVSGTSIPIINRNGLSKNTFITKIYRGPTYTGGVVFLPDQAGFGTNPGQSAPGELFANIELVIPPFSKYVMKITPSATATLVMEAEMYEIDPAKDMV